MKITIFGSGTSIGVPVIGCNCKVCRSTDARDNRLRASALWSIDGKNILIDAGPDFRTQMLRYECSRLDAILITHLHYDHVGGLDDVRGINYSMRQSAEIYAEERVAEAIKYNLHYVFAPKPYPGVPEMNLHVIDDNKFLIGDIEVTPIRMLHHKMPIFGYRIGNWAYLTDGSQISDEAIDKLSGCEVLIINALREKEHMSHFSLSEALEIIDRVKPKRAYLTHICHDLGLHEEVNARLPEGVELAYDGLVIE